MQIRQPMGARTGLELGMITAPYVSSGSTRMAPRFFWPAPTSIRSSAPSAFPSWISPRWKSAAPPANMRSPSIAAMRPSFISAPCRSGANGGGLHLGGAQGAIVEWAVHLRRFDETQTFDRLAETGALDLALMAPLAETIAVAHEQAPVRDNGATQMLRHRLEDTLDGLAAASDIFPPEEVAALRREFSWAFRRGRADFGETREVGPCAALPWRSASAQYRAL